MHALFLALLFSKSFTSATYLYRILHGTYMYRLPCAECVPAATRARASRNARVRALHTCKAHHADAKRHGHGCVP